MLVARFSANPHSKKNERLAFAGFRYTQTSTCRKF